MDAECHFLGGSAGSHQPEQNVPSVTVVGHSMDSIVALRCMSALLRVFFFFNRNLRPRDMFSSPRGFTYQGTDMVVAFFVFIVTVASL